MAQTTYVRDHSGNDRKGPVAGRGHRVVTTNNETGVAAV